MDWATAEMTGLFIQIKHTWNVQVCLHMEYIYMYMLYIYIYYVYCMWYTHKMAILIGNMMMVWIQG